MPGLWRTRVASFFAGSGLTALLAFGILRQDLQRQFGTLGEQVHSSQGPASSLDQRVARLEAALADQQQQPAPQH
jgi:hypothetical protein